MEYQIGPYNSIEELNRRASELPLVRGDNMELMDEYTRCLVLRKHRQDEVYAYVGALGE